MEPQDERHHVSDVRQRIAIYRGALQDAGYNGESLQPPSSAASASRPSTSTHEAFEVFARLEAAPTVLTIIDLFADQSRLRESNDFAVSCLPANNQTPRGSTHATAISVGWVEVLGVLMDRATEAVSEVTIWCEPEEDLDWLAAWPQAEIYDSDLDGGGFAVVLPEREALELMTDPSIAPVLARRVAGIRRRRRRVRRADWHNRWLWALADFGFASPSLKVEAYEGVNDVSAPDVLRLARQRTSQQKFRALLLANQPNECAICGIDVKDVLEAAHLKAHAEGGAASIENGRLLCANHHRAYDAHLYWWTGSEFAWDSPGPEPSLGRG